MTKEPQKIYIVYDYWVDSETNMVYAIYTKEGILYFLEKELKQ